MHDDDWELEFAPANPEQRAAPVSAVDDSQSFPVNDSTTAGVLAEINRLQESKANWGATLLILLVSGVLFYLIGSAAWNWKTVALLIPILLFHELGHYLAMLAFGYRNLRMFFIPLFGAAVTGRNYNVAAWKKAVVSLMGPVPGIGVGIALGIAAYVLGQKLLLEAAALMVFINGINLLPILPLDGGWILHAIVFSRHYVLDVGFRLVAALLLVSGGAALHEYFLLYLGAAMLLGLPMEYRRSQVVSRLRREHFAARSLDSQTIPEETARRIIAEIDASYPKRISDRATARLTLQIFESLNARPPGILAIVTLAAVHFAAFVVALFFSIVFFVALHANANQPVLPNFVPKPVTALPMHSVAANTLLTWHGTKASASPQTTKTLIGTFADRKQGETAFQAFTAKLPAEASAELFGQSLFVTLPVDPKLEQKWQTELESRCPDVRIDKAKANTTWTFAATAPSEEAATLLEQEINHYLSLSRVAFLIPPWSPQRLTREQHLARTTYAKVDEAQTRLAADPRYEKVTSPLFREIDKNNQSLVKLQQAFDQIQRETVAQAVAEIRREGNQAVDFKVLDLYSVTALPMHRGKDKTYQPPAAAAELWQRLGQLPLDKGMPKANADRFSIITGHVERTGSRLRLQWLSFPKVSEGLPAFTQWLNDEHCVDLKYRIERQTNADDDEAEID
jgi:Zn-dependent protease